MCAIIEKFLENGAHQIPERGIVPILPYLMSSGG